MCCQFNSGDTELSVGKSSCVGGEWSRQGSSVIQEVGGWCLRSEMRVALCHLVLANFLLFSSFPQNIGLYKFKYLHTVSIHMSGQIHDDANDAFRCFPTAGLKEINRVSECQKEKQKKTGSFFPEMERFWCKLLFFCVSWGHISRFHANRKTKKCTCQSQNKTQRTNSDAQLCFCKKRLPLRTCAGTNTSVNVQSVDTLSGDIVWTYLGFVM